MSIDDMNCTGCAGIDRRAFLSKTMIAAAAAALAACASDSLTAPASIDATVTIAEHPELAAVGGVALVTLNNSPVAIVRTTTDAFVALSRVCPHQGQLINKNGSNGFLCSGHQAQFTLNGTWKGGQVTSNMRAYAVTFDATAGTLKIG